MFRLLRIQPFKGLYLTWQAFTTLLIRIPCWFILAVPTSWRPRADWSVQKTVRFKLTRYLSGLIKVIGPIRATPNHLAITPGVDVNGVWISPISELIQDELKIWAAVAHVNSVPIPGYWTHKKDLTIPVNASPMPGEKVVYALHGGGYVTLSAHPSDPSAAVARGLLEHIDSVHRVFSCEYRLSSGVGLEAKDAFPAALIDALAGYIYLVKTVGFDPSDIIIEGDSAGGNLAHALTRYLVEHPDSGLPAPPGALILLSAWVDLSAQVADPNSSWTRNVKTDFIGLVDINGYLRAIRSFLGPHGLGAGETNPFISPASKNIAMKIHFKGFPRTFIAAGGSEVFYDMICVLRDRMVRDLGENKVKFHAPPGGTHDYTALPWFEPERTETLKAIAAWVAAE